MPETCIDLEIGTIVASYDAIPLANSQATDLEALATELRLNADGSLIQAFETANKSLQSKFRDDLLTPLEVVRAVVNLNDLDPHNDFADDSKDRRRVVSAFEALRIGQPILNLFDYKSKPSFGIIVTSPKVKLLMPSKKLHSLYNDNRPITPTVDIKLKLQTIDRSGEVQVEEAVFGIYALASAVIGRPTIEDFVRTAKFKKGTNNSARQPVVTVYGSELQDLREKIDKLYQLGMEPISTQVLDSALFNSVEYTEQGKRRSDQRNSRLRQSTRHL
ncbi:MAG: hypothetical protein ABI220_02595 [Candidatus Saccharimonadales bacterium]